MGIRTLAVAAAPRAAQADWQLVAYGNAVHAFTNPDAGDDNAKGAAYDAAADRRSWEAMKDFFAETIRSTSSASTPTFSKWGDCKAIVDDCHDSPAFAEFLAGAVSPHVRAALRGR